MQALLDALSRTQHPIRSEVAEMPPLQLLQQRPELADLYNALSGVASNVGTPVDLMTLAMRPFGYDEPAPFMGSEWVGQRLGADTGSKAFLGGQVGAPDPTDGLRLAQHFPDLIGAMTVFHGSPHKWDKVDLSKVGTGEGAQAYGHGFYVAENKGVADSYRKALSKGDISFTKGGLDETLSELENRIKGMEDYYDSADFANAPYDPKAQANMGWLKRNRKMLADVKALADDPAYSQEERAWQIQQEIFNNGFPFDASDLIHVDKGHLYELDLPDETIDKMLDYDAPLSEQPENVRKVIEEEFGDAVIDDGGTKLHDRFGVWEAKDLSGERLYYDLAKSLGSQAAASKRLAELGIPGIRYLDGTSRSAGDGTRNFVIFDEQYIKPLTRNGEPIAPDLQRAMDEALPDGTPLEDALVVMHNMTAENLKHAERMGGMPMPSVGIAKAAHPIEGYGDITLLGGPEMAVPSAKNPVYSSDAYSPRYPRVTEVLSEADQAKLSAFVSEPFGVDRAWKTPRSTGGYRPGERYISDLYDDGTIESHGLGGIANTETIKARYLWEKGEMPDIADYPDKFEWVNAVRDRVKSDDPEYLKWAETIKDRIGIAPEEKLFGGWTNQGRKRMIPHTLDNVMKEMRKEMKDSNQTNMFGSGALRAKVAPKFRTIEQIKKARGRIKPAAELDKDALNNKLFDLSSEFGQYAKYKDSNQFIQGDRVRDQLVEISAGQSKWDDYFDDVPDELKARWGEYLDELKNAPTAYFEAKPQRAVQLSEFKNALIPESAGTDIADALARHGLDVERYADDADKAQRIMAKRNLLFQHPAATVLGGSLAAALLAQMANSETMQ